MGAREPEGEGAALSLSRPQLGPLVLAPSGAGARGPSLATSLRASAAAAPEQPALIGLARPGAPARSWSYADLLHDAERLARALASRHEPGTRVAVCADGDPEWVLLFLACSLAGLTLVTIDPSSTTCERHDVVTRTHAQAFYWGWRCDGAGASGTPLDDRDALFSGERAGRLRSAARRDPVLIAYTSCASGGPVVATLDHSRLIAGGVAAMADLGVVAGGVVRLNRPRFHNPGCAAIACGGLGAGATLLIDPGPDVSPDGRRR